MRTDLRAPTPKLNESRKRLVVTAPTGVVLVCRSPRQYMAAIKESVDRDNR